MESEELNSEHLHHSGREVVMLHNKVGKVNYNWFINHLSSPTQTSLSTVLTTAGIPPRISLTSKLQLHIPSHFTTVSVDVELSLISDVYLRTVACTECKVTLHTYTLSVQVNHLVTLTTVSF